MNLKEKTILYLITQSELGGAQRYVFDLAKSLKNENNIMVAFGEPGQKGELAGQLKEENIRFYALPHLKRQISPLNDFLAMIEIIKLIKKEKPDIIHLNSSKISILGSLAVSFIKITSLNHKSKIINYKLIYTVHGWVFNEPMPKWRKIFYKYAEKLTARAKDKLICVSEADRQIALGEKIAPAEKLITIHNGIAPIQFLSRGQARQKLFSRLLSRSQPFPSSQKPPLLLGSIGNLYPTKGFSYLIQASRLLWEKGYDFYTIIIGLGPEQDRLNSLIKKLNLAGRVILAGRINPAAVLLPAFDIYVCSSVKEGLSYTVLEAMAAGQPIVASEVGGNPELIANKKEGVLVPPQNAGALAQAIISLINNPGWAKKLGQKARQKAIENFTLKEMAAKTKNLY